MNKELEKDLLLTKAMADGIEKVDRWNSLNDVVDEIFSNEALDRNQYLHSVMELTRSGFILSDIENEEDIEMSEAVGYDIQGLTKAGEEYVNGLLHEPTIGEKAKDFLKQFDEACGKVIDNNLVKIILSVLPCLMKG